MAEGARRLAYLVVVGGPLKDRRYDLEEVVTEVLIGADGDCHLVVDLPGISPIHARIWADLDGATVHDTHAPQGVYVNDDRIQGQAPIRAGDWLWLGAPGDPGSVCIQCHFEEWKEVLPEVPVGEAPAPRATALPDDDEAPIPVVALDEEEVATAAEAPPDAGPVLLEAEPVAPVLSEPTPAEAPPTEAPSREEAFFVAAEPPPAASEAPAPPPPPPPPPPAPPPGPEPAAAPEPLAPEPLEPSPAETPARPAEPEPAAEDDAFFVAAEEPAGVPASPDVVSPPPPAPEPPAASPPEEPPPPPARGAGASDPFFVGETITQPPAPVAPGPAAPAGGGEEDHFFIAGDLLTEPAPGEPVSPAADEDSFVAAEPVGDEPVVEAEPLEAEPIVAAEPLPEGEPIVAAEELVPEPALTDRAPLPPRQDASKIPEPPPPPPPSAEVPGAGEDVLAAEAVPEALQPSAPAPSVPPGPTPAPAAPVAPASPAAPSGDVAEAPPAPERRRPAAARRGAAGGRRPARRPARGGRPAWLGPVGLGAGLALAVGVVGLGLWAWLGRTVTVEQVSPARVRVGQRATVTGSGFSQQASQNTVLFGDAEAQVLGAASSRLEVSVPEAVTEAGTERKVMVTVQVGSRVSEPVEVSVFQGPRLHGLSPDVAMPGEEVLLAGAGWGIGATVRFGDVPAEILDIDSSQIRVRVPQIPGYATAAPAVVSVGGVDSNAAPFFVGRLPLLTGMNPSSARSGDLLTLSGRGFGPQSDLNGVRIAGRPALVVAARSDELQVVVPRLPPGEPMRAVEVYVAETEQPAQGLVQVADGADPLELRFVAEPFDQESEGLLAVVATDLGPAFVLAAANGQTAAQRAVAAQGRLNAAAATLAGAPGLVPEARDLTTRPVIALAGQSEALLQVTNADAAAYNEDWTRQGRRGGPVTPARLARWWEAVSRDLVLMLVRGERPRFAAALAREGQALQQLYDSASGSPGIPRQTLTDARSSIQSGLRIVGLRVPASVTAAVPPTPGATAAAAAPTPTPAALELPGEWTGSELEGGRRRYLTVTFRRNHGSVSYEGGITLTVPFLSLEQPERNRVRFTVQIRGGIRHYVAEWDGETLSGNISKDPAGNNVVGTFELRPR